MHQSISLADCAIEVVGLVVLAKCPNALPALDSTRKLDPDLRCRISISPLQGCSQKICQILLKITSRIVFV